MKLTEYLDALAYDIGFWMVGLRNPGYPADQLGDLSIELCTKLRAAAIIVLLTKADTDACYHNLIRSGQCRLTYLRRMEAEGLLTDHHRASGRVDALLDTIAADQFELAREIAGASPTDWMQGHEYEEDFCYAQVLHSVIAVTADRARLTGLIARHERLLDGKADARLEVAKSFASRDGAAFAEAFESVLAQRDAQIDADKKRPQLDEPHVIAQRQVFVEGLALLRIAERLGFALEPEYRFCPSIARQPMRRPFPAD